MWNSRGLRAATVLLLAGFLLTPERASAAAQPSPAALGACGGSVIACARSVVGMLNHTRATHHLAPLRLIISQSVGAKGCVGSLGHSLAMARSGEIWHSNTKYPRASFPRDVCSASYSYGENVGESDSGNVLSDLQQLHALMMSEPHSRTVCAQTVSHACNILNPAFTRVGVGVYVSAGTTWLTEDFLA